MVLDEIDTCIRLICTNVIDVHFLRKEKNLSQNKQESYWSYYFTIARMINYI